MNLMMGIHFLLKSFGTNGILDLLKGHFVWPLFMPGRIFYSIWRPMPGAVERQILEAGCNMDADSGGGLHNLKDDTIPLGSPFLYFSVDWRSY
jgi:hypothetical protein